MNECNTCLQTRRNEIVKRVIKGELHRALGAEPTSDERSSTEWKLRTRQLPTVVWMKVLDPYSSHSPPSVYCFVVSNTHGSRLLQYVLAVLLCYGIMPKWLLVRNLVSFYLQNMDQALVIYEEGCSWESLAIFDCAKAKSLGNVFWR